MIQRESPSAIEEAAVRWVWRLEQQGRTPDIMAELNTWLAGDTRRQGAFLHAESVWVMLDAVQQLPREPIPEISAEAPEISEASTQYSRTQRSPVTRRALLAAGLAAAAGLAGVPLLRRSVKSAGTVVRYGTQMGEIRTLRLSDGSAAAINTQSLLDVDFRSDARMVNLLQGEVWFEVAKQPAQPFVVQAGSVRVRAVGTEFSVRILSSGSQVLVGEGTVEAWVQGAEEQKIRLRAGTKAIIERGARIYTDTSAGDEIDRELAWREGKIDPSGLTLEQAAAEFNRYNNRKLVIDPSLAAERFYGVFRTGDPEGFARAVSESLHANVIENDPDTILVQRTEGASVSHH
jgi:transmembrane sensor